MISTMKKILSIALCVFMGTTACSSCASKTPAPIGPDATPTATVTVTVIPPPPPTTVSVKQDNWEFTLPGPGWEPMIACTQGACPTALINKDKKNLVVFVSEKTDATFDQYTLIAVRGTRSAGANIASTKQVEINGHKFVLIESSKNNIRVWMWVTLLQGKGYGLSCGGPLDDASQHDLCFGVANTLKIN